MPSAFIRTRIYSSAGKGRTNRQRHIYQDLHSPLCLQMRAALVPMFLFAGGDQLYGEGSSMVSVALVCKTLVEPNVKRGQ